jgi:hypothetical protein
MVGELATTGSIAFTSHPQPIPICGIQIRLGHGGDRGLRYPEVRHYEKNAEVFEYKEDQGATSPSIRSSASLPFTGGLQIPCEHTYAVV